MAVKIIPIANTQKLYRFTLILIEYAIYVMSRTLP